MSNILIKIPLDYQRQKIDLVSCRRTKHTI